MEPLFTPTGEQALEAAVREAPLLAFDFDGTLAPIVSDPKDARVPTPIARRLRRLARALPCAVITGRRIADVRGRLGFTPRFVVGNHGAEDGSPASEQIHLQFEALRARLREHEAAFATAGVRVEDKHYSMALHYRNAPDTKLALAAIMATLSGIGAPLEIGHGKCVVNIVSSHANDKAGALASLVAAAGASHAIFVGDDVNDEPVFERDAPNWLTVRVGCDEPSSRARFCVDGQTGVARMLDQILVVATGRADPGV